MAHDPTPQTEADQHFDESLRRALETPPISNEAILKRSKESRAKRTKVKDANDRHANVSIAL